ncbi:SH3 domain-containing protein [Sphingomonas sp. SUN039]|uniref:SH3 domain-containing protein n=1 Tax=Sphingomonas sp. SUN039 TaxID=2937787 RepID=UPI002164691A|nr:SH3 domain-containing protein [Sphingomonas sp. SUN039]UVO55558.1 SH3 domain-containing protein [Sphingomonas sp. SUN039]
MSFARTSFGLTTVAALALVSVPAHAIDPTIAQAAEQVLANRSAANVDDGQRSTGGGLLGNIFGCSEGGNKQIIGAVAGGAVGGLIGSKIKGTVGTILGGALGAAAGSALGCKLQKNDRMRAERATQAAIASGKSQEWQNTETGASGKVEVANSAGSSLGDLKFADGVEPASGFTKVGGSYTSASAANVRSAPNTTGTVLAKLTPGQRVWVPASVTGSPWMLVSDGGVAQGYVSAPLLQKSVAVASSCKIVKQNVSVPGEAAQSETYQACKDKTGAWVMTRV